MRNNVCCYCQSCLVCASRKGPGRRQRPKLQPIPVGGPFHTVGVDVLQLPRSLEGNQYAIVAVEVRKRTLYWKLILRKWRPKFSNDFDVIIDVVLDCLVYACEAFNGNSARICFMCVRRCIVQ